MTGPAGSLPMRIVIDTNVFVAARRSGLRHGESRWLDLKILPDAWRR